MYTQDELLLFTNWTLIWPLAELTVTLVPSSCWIISLMTSSVEPLAVLILTSPDKEIIVPLIDELAPEREILPEEIP